MAMAGTRGHGYFRPFASTETGDIWFMDFFPCCASDAGRQQCALISGILMNQIDLFAKSLFFIGVIDASYASCFVKALFNRWRTSETAQFGRIWMDFVIGQLVLRSEVLVVCDFELLSVVAV